MLCKPVYISLLFVALLFVSHTVAADGHKRCSAKHKHKSHKSPHAHGGSSSSHGSGHGSGHNSSNDSGSSASTGSKSKFTPNGKKAGIAGGDSLRELQKSISWMTTWTPNPYKGTDLGDVEFASMCWGLGRTSHDDDAKRFEEFKKVPHGKYKYVIGFNEADFKGEGSSGVIEPKEAASAWDKYIAPHGKKGSVLVSPSCAKQQDEDWMGPFLKAVETQPDVINVHIFKNKASDIKTVLDHFAKYNKPMWITEMACIDYSNGNHAFCSQEQTTSFLNEAIKLLEADDRVAAYAWSDAYNGPNCKLTKDGKLSDTGKQLERVYSSMHKRNMVKASPRALAPPRT